jgi:transcriptional regulator with XRE-family HTH domain
MSPRRAQSSLNPEDVRQGATLRAFREKSGLKTGEAANALNISYAYLSNIEAGRKPLTPVLLAKAAALYSVPQAAIARPDLFGDLEASA